MSVNMDQQKKEEKYFFKKFIALYPIPDGDISYTEQPDVIINGSTRIGIEIAKLYLKHGSDPTSEQRQQPLRELVLQKAQRYHLFSGGKNIGLTVSFDPKNPIDHKDHLAKKIGILASSLDS